MRIIDLPFDPDGPCYHDFMVVVPYVPSTYAYPYISLITGPDPKYRLKRHFLRREHPYWSEGVYAHHYTFPLIGVYEIGIKRWDCETQDLISRKVSYLNFNGEDIEEISRESVIKRFAG